jgi:hypothetical protein
MKAALIPLALNELLGVAQLSLQLGRSKLSSSPVFSSFNPHSLWFRHLTLELTRRPTIATT